jgi:cellulose synthase (UDP-forming)
MAGRVAYASKRHVHLLLSEISLAQERHLVNLIYSRPEAWVSWHKSRGTDHPLLSFAHIFWLGLRGIAVILPGLFTHRPSADEENLEMHRRKRRAPFVAACVLLAGTFGSFTQQSWAVDTSGAQNSPDQQATSSPPSPRPAAAFHDQYELGMLAERGAIAFTGPGSSRNFFLDMPLTKIISAASLDLRYRAPLVRAGENRLGLWLNGTRVGSLPLNSGSQEVNVDLPADLLTTNNKLTLQLEGDCSACKRIRAPWITIAPASLLNLSGARLPLANDLALLPIPFFDPAGQHAWSLPIVFSDRPDTEALKAASVVASWFGISSDFRGVRFPTTIGELPQGNAIVFALRDSDLLRGLSVPATQGGLIAIRENPRDPYGKLLVIAGDTPEDLLTAAQALVTRNNAEKHVDAVSVRQVRVP